MAKTQTIKDSDKQVALDYDIDTNKSYKFRLLRQREGRVLIHPEGEIIDDVTGKKRKIRLHPDSITPFLDEQIENGLDANETPYTSPIVFVAGSFTVEGYDEPLIRYLLAHGFNTLRKKHMDARTQDYLFELVDYVEIAKKDLAVEEDKLDAKLLVRTKFKEDIKTLEYFMVSRFGIKNEEEISFKNKVYDYAERFPKLFLEDLNNSRHKIKYDITQAFERGILKANSKGEVTWKTGAIVGVFAKDEEGKVSDSLSVWASSSAKGVKEFKELLDSEVNK